MSYQKRPKHVKQLQQAAQLQFAKSKPSQKASVLMLNLDLIATLLVPLLDFQSLSNMKSVCKRIGDRCFTPSTISVLYIKTFPLMANYPPGLALKYLSVHDQHVFMCKYLVTLRKHSKMLLGFVRSDVENQKKKLRDVDDFLFQHCRHETKETYENIRRRLFSAWTPEEGLDEFDK
jgi:hypothetical protein